MAAEQEMRPRYFRTAVSITAARVTSPSKMAQIPDNYKLESKSLYFVVEQGIHFQ